MSEYRSEVGSESDQLRARIQRLQASRSNIARELRDQWHREHDKRLAVEDERKRLRTVVETATDMIERAQFTDQACDVCTEVYRVLGDESIAAQPETTPRVGWEEAKLRASLAGARCARDEAVAERNRLRAVIAGVLDGLAGPENDDAVASLTTEQVQALQTSVQRTDHREIITEQDRQQRLASAADGGTPMFKMARSLLGQYVTVTLERATENTSAVVATGQLLGLADSGEVVILAEDGFCHYCWPMIDIQSEPDDA